MGDSVDRVLEQWHAERPDIDPSPMGVVGRISRASVLLSRALGANFAKYDLQRWEFDIIGTLLRSGPPYRLTAGRLTAATMVTSGAITNRIDRLVARGLVDRVTDPDNRRSVLISLTQDGRDLANEVVAHHAAYEAELLDPLTGRERDQLATLLRKLLTGLGDTPPTK